jgi:hypothetical protein
MPTQTTSNILMIRPVRFGFNEQTAESNAFQDIAVADQTKGISQSEALTEFDAMVKWLRDSGVNVIVFDDTAEPHTPDSIFPNNWVSFHQSGKVILYPMQAENRRLERRMDIIEALSTNFHVEQVIDLSYFEPENKFLEGTGSMVLDRKNRIAYACLSPRTNLDVLTAFSKVIDYKIVTFEATDINNKAIYHTNVVMCVGDVFVVICLEAIKNLDERLAIREAIEKSGKEVIEISLSQMNCFAGNMLLVNNTKGEKLLVMSTSAYQSLTPKQIGKLNDHARLTHFDLSMIEGNGGGSARCMMAEVHLPKK